MYVETRWELLGPPPGASEGAHVRTFGSHVRTCAPWLGVHLGKGSAEAVEQRGANVRTSEHLVRTFAPGCERGFMFFVEIPNCASRNCGSGFRLFFVLSMFALYVFCRDS